MKLVFDNNDHVIRFGMERIKQVLHRKNIHFFESYEGYSVHVLPSKGVVVQTLDKSNNKSNTYRTEEFSIFRDKDIIFIRGIDSRGLMYGCLEWAEQLDRGLMLQDQEEIRQKPALRIRGIKYNLPYAPFEEGDPFVANEGTCLSKEFWWPYIDMLAENRYNCLSLWSEHPFHLMVVSSKYREANPFSDSEIEKNIDFFRSLINYAKNRGIDVYLFTWNIRLLPEIAKGLGLPDAVGDVGNMYDHLIHRVGITLNKFRMTSATIKDYFREMILQVLLTYPELKGLGTSASEWMDGSGYEREEWIMDTYVEAIQQSGRKIPFIHRTNMQNAGNEINEVVKPCFEEEDFYISWKYSNAHCYSHPQPQFEEEWNAWQGIELEKTQVLYTVRNDDVHTHRWGDPDYVRAYVKGMLKPYVKGFYWGADGYTWGKDFQHVNYGHKTWTYDFEKHLFQFQLWGRLSYNPEIDEGVWEYLLDNTYGRELAGRFLEGLRNASKIIPAVNRLFWLDYDFQWHAESCLSQVSGFKTIEDFMRGKAMPGVGVRSVENFAIAEHEDRLEGSKKKYKETPLDIIQVLTNASNKVENVAREIDRELGEGGGSHSYCALLDLYSWVELGRYYKTKFEAALELNRYELNGDEKHKILAVSLLQQGYRHWENLCSYWSRHNKPYFMARVKMTFGYPYYLDDVKADIDKAKQFQFVGKRNEMKHLGREML